MRIGSTLVRSDAPPPRDRIEVGPRPSPGRGKSKVPDPTSSRNVRSRTKSLADQGVLSAKLKLFDRRQLNDGPAPLNADHGSRRVLVMGLDIIVATALLAGLVEFACLCQEAPVAPEE